MSMAMATFDDLVLAQERAIYRLAVEKAEFVAEGDEYHAAQVDEDLVAAKSLARLLHPARMS